MADSSDLVMVVFYVLNALDRHLVSGSDWYACMQSNLKTAAYI